MSCTAFSLSTNPFTPSSTARLNVSSSLYIVRMTICVGNRLPCSFRATSRPDKPGRLTSSTAISGFFSSINWSALLPSPASPTSSNRWSASITWRNPWRNRGWSSTIKTLTRPGMIRGYSQTFEAMARLNSPAARLPRGRCRSAAFGDRNDRLDACSGSRAGVHFERASEDAHSFGNIFQPEASGGGLACWPRSGKSAAIILDPEAHIVHVPFQYDARAPGLGMFQNVVHGFLNHTIEICRRLPAEYLVHGLQPALERNGAGLGRVVDHRHECASQAELVELIGVQVLRNLAHLRNGLRGKLLNALELVARIGGHNNVVERQQRAVFDQQQILAEAV